jgi:hypothetical protein
MTESVKRNRKNWQGYLKNNSIYIFLFSIYPILFLYYQNISEVTFREILPPMALAVVFTVILWFFLKLIYQSKEKRALVIFIILLTVFYFKFIYDLIIEIIGPFSKPFSHLSSIILICGFLVFLFYRIRKSKHLFFNVGKILNIIMLVLLAWNIGGILIYHIHNVKIRNARFYLKKTGFLKPSPTSLKPDIYCFFVYEFASLETIADLFHYDNSEFAERLQAAGFFIAQKSRGLYEWTPEAIAAVLNMEKVPEKTDPGILVKQNKVTRFLKEQGYEIYDFPYGGLTALSDSAKHFFYSQERSSIFFNDFYKTLIEMSVFYSWVQSWQNDEDKYSLFFRKRILYVFEQMPAIVKMAGPKFVLVHLFSPHAPFVFNKDGGVVAPEHSIDYSDRKYYLEQYLYISRRLAETAEMILKESATPPIIVALSDHGYRGSFRKPLLHIVSNSEKRKIFLSLYLPGYPYAQLGATLSPLNVFRIILNHYFGQGLPEVKSQE